MDVVATVFEVEGKQYEQIDEDHSSWVHNDVVEDIVGGDEDATVAKVMGGDAVV